MQNSRQRSEFVLSARTSEQEFPADKVTKGDCPLAQVSVSHACWSFTRHKAKEKKENKHQRSRGALRNFRLDLSWGAASSKASSSLPLCTFKCYHMPRLTLWRLAQLGTGKAISNARVVYSEQWQAARGSLKVHVGWMHRSMSGTINSHLSPLPDYSAKRFQPTSASVRVHTCVWMYTYRYNKLRLGSSSSNLLLVSSQSTVSDEPSLSCAERRALHKQDIILPMMKVTCRKKTTRGQDRLGLHLAPDAMALP